MRLRFLTIAMAIAALFTAQQAVAKSHKSAKTPKSASAKKHSKKHAKKAGLTSTTVRAA